MWAAASSKITLLLPGELCIFSLTALSAQGVGTAGKPNSINHPLRLTAGDSGGPGAEGLGAVGFVCFTWLFPCLCCGSLIPHCLLVDSVRVSSDCPWRHPDVRHLCSAWELLHCFHPPENGVKVGQFPKSSPWRGPAESGAGSPAAGLKQKLGGSPEIGPQSLLFSF